MSYLQMTFPQLLAEIETIKRVNISTLDELAPRIENLYELTTETEVKYVVDSFDVQYRFFAQADRILNDLWNDLSSEELSYALVNRLGELGESSFNTNLRFSNDIEKETFYKVNGTAEDFNSSYALIGDNFNTLSELASIADALSSNFIHTSPLKDVARKNIRFQDGRGFSLTHNDEIYFGESIIPITGQRRALLLAFIEAPEGQAINWIALRNILTSNEDEMDQKTVVKRVSALRTSLEGFGIELEQINRGIDASWTLVVE